MKSKLNYVEFYITNVCNFGCNQCNRLNNYKFSGHYTWEDKKDKYKQWSELLDIDYITVLGGEPTLNLDLKNWLIGIRALWPNAKIELLTNGSRVEHLPWLYETALDQRINVTISVHNIERYFKLYNWIKSNLNPPLNLGIFLDYNLPFVDTSSWLQGYNTIKDNTWPECNSVEDFLSLPQFILNECIDVHKVAPQLSVIDANNVNYRMQLDNVFVTAPLKYTGNNQFNVYESNPNDAHDVCISKTCHHFIDGKLYKCHHVGLLPEFMKQYQVNISNEDKELLLSYEPATPDMPIKQLHQFFSELKEVIPQCKLCPSKKDISQNLLDNHTVLIKPVVRKIEK